MVWAQSSEHIEALHPACLMHCSAIASLILDCLQHAILHSVTGGVGGGKEATAVPIIYSHVELNWHLCSLCFAKVSPKYSQSSGEIK